MRRAELQEGDTMNSRLALVGIGAVLATLAGCSNQNYNVKRVDPTTSTDDVVDALVEGLLSARRVNQRRR